jgi:hypothetical protein
MTEGWFEQAVDVDELTEAFIDEFGADLDEAHLDALTSGGFRSAPNPEVLPDPETVDPVQDPQLALAILKTRPASEIVPAEQPLILPLVPYLRKSKQPIPPDIAVLAKQYDFYLVKYGLDAIRRGKERFESLEFRVDYPAQQLTITMTPDTELETRFSARSSVRVGVNASLSFQVPEIAVAPVASLGGGAGADVATNLIYSWDYRVLRAEVIATGAKSSYSQWIINRPQELVGALECAAVLRVPVGAKELSFSISGSYAVRSGIAWWKRRPTRTFRTRESLVLPL